MRSNHVLSTSVFIVFILFSHFSFLITVLFSSLCLDSILLCLTKRKGKSVLANITSKPFAAIEILLRNMHPQSDYQYHVPSNRVGRAIELLNISPTIRYIILRLYDIVTVQKERLVIFTYTPDVAWTALCFCLNWGVRAAWLRAGVTQAERDRIISDFNKNGTNYLEASSISPHDLVCGLFSLLSFAGDGYEVRDVSLCLCCSFLLSLIIFLVSFNFV